MMKHRETQEVDRDRFARLVPAALIPPSALYELAYLSGAFNTWRTRGRTLTIDDFSQLLLGEAVASFAVLDPRESDRLIGYVGLHSVDMASGVASISAFFDLRNGNSLLAAGHALHQMVDHAFFSIGLRKLMLELPGAHALTAARRSLAWKAIIRQEGTLRAHVLIGGAYSDVEVFAIFADEYREWRSRAAISQDYGEAHEIVCGLIEEFLGEELERPIDGGTRLVDDLNLDSLLLVELSDRIEALGGDLSDLDPQSPDLCVQDLTSALERGRSGSWNGAL